MKRKIAIIGLLFSAAPFHATAQAPNVPLLSQFRDPPMESRPRVWWHWLNGNITKDGLAKDLAWMKRVGIGGVQTFDAAMQTPQIVDERLSYMSPEWRDAFQFAASEADRLDMELTIASSAGWSATGGPWVKPEDAMKKLVWSETVVPAGKAFAGSLPTPPNVTGPFQSIPIDPQGGLMLTGAGHKLPIAAPFYRDVRVLAWPVSATDQISIAQFSDGGGKALDSAPLIDADLTTALALPRPKKGAPQIVAQYDRAVTIRSATLYVQASAGRYTGGNIKPVLEASDDGKAWRAVTTIPASAVPTTVSFAPVTARSFRVSFNVAPGGGAAGFRPQTPGVDMAALGQMLGSSGAAPASNAMRVADFQLSPQARVDRFETKAAFDLTDKYFDLTNDVPDGSAVADGSVVDLTNNMHNDGTLHWTPPRLPKGQQWRILRLGYSLVGTVNHPATPEATGLEVDKYDGAAVRRYMEHYLGLYKQAAGSDLVGKHGVRAVLTDSIEAGAANWTPDLVAEFTRLRGYDPTPWLPTLTGTIIGSRADSDRFLYDYRRTLADLIASEHYGTIASVAHENEMIVYGEALENKRPSLGDDMAMRRHADIPMSAVWTYARDTGPSPAYIADMRGAASVAHIYGKKYVAAETMTSLLSPWAFGPNDVKRVVDLAFASGINRPIIHTSVHAPTDDKKPGLSLFIFGQYFNRHESWAELAKPWIDYIARNSWMLQKGRNVADVGYFYGEEAPLTGLYSESGVANAPISYGYDFINADALVGALANDGDEVVTTGGARYKVLYLGGASQMMTLPTLQKLAGLVAGGATVVGQKPIGNPSLGDDEREYAALKEQLWPDGGIAKIGAGQMIASDDIEKVLAQLGHSPDFRFTGGQTGTQILFQHRKLSDGDSYFLSNRMDRTETIEAHFRVTGKAPELWDAMTGEVKPVSYRMENGITIVPMTMVPDGSVHVVFRKEASKTAVTNAPEVLVQQKILNDGWNVKFEAGRGAPSEIALTNLIPLNEHRDVGVKYFSGIATYDRMFDAPRGWRPGAPLWIDLGEAKEIAEVSVNGQVAGSVWSFPYRLNIGPMTRRGSNRLQVKVANLWVNRLIGDAQPGATPIAWAKSSPTYTAKAPLRQSGLIGPVSLSTIDKRSR